jgi:cation:H+ antiporter
MEIAAWCVLWVLGLGLALFGSEKLVSYLSEIGEERRMGQGLLGLLVAFGADGPEVTSALIAVASGSSAVGLGVVVGSNIYNIAGLLALTAVIVRWIPTSHGVVVLEGGFSALLALLLVALLVLPAYHLALAIAMIVTLGCYALLISVGRHWLSELVHRPILDTPDDGEAVNQAVQRSVARRVGLIALSVVGIIVGSDVLVRSSLLLGPKIGIPSIVMGTLVLAIATSLPNTWAAISLGRRGFTAAAVAATFNSNSINAAIGAGVPALFVQLRTGGSAGGLEPIGLLVMTTLAIFFTLTGKGMNRVEGLAVIGVYIAFVIIRLAVA